LNESGEIESRFVDGRKNEIENTKPVYLAAFILDRAKDIMGEFMDKIDARKQNTVIYGDTDSMMIHRRDLPKLEEDMSGKGLGFLTDELEGGLAVQFGSIGPKAYWCEYIKDGKSHWKNKLKGIPLCSQNDSDARKDLKQITLTVDNTKTNLFNDTKLPSKVFDNLGIEGGIAFTYKNPFKQDFENLEIKDVVQRRTIGLNTWANMTWKANDNDKSCGGEYVPHGWRS
jgi:hypothetical protein